MVTNKINLESQWKDWADSHEKIKYKGPGTVSTKSTQIMQAKALQDYFYIDDKTKILEIGPDSGFLAKTLLEKYNNKIIKYTVVDGDIVLNFLKEQFK